MTTAYKADIAHGASPSGPITDNFFSGTPGDDHLNGTANADEFDLSQGGNDIANGLGGADLLELGTTLTAADRLNGGKGYDTVDLSGDYSAGVVLSAHTITNVEELDLEGGDGSFPGNTYNLTLNQHTDVAGHGMLILLEDVGSDPDTLIVDGSAVSGDLRMQNLGSGDDHLIGGSGNDYLNAGESVGGGGLSDVIDGGAGINKVGFTGFGSVTFSLLALGTTQDLGNGHMETVSNVQDVVGAHGADNITGDDRDNWIATDGGSDTITANGGNDLVDISLGSGESDVNADGGTGSDTVSFHLVTGNNPVSFSLALQGTMQTCNTLIKIDATNFENVTGTVLDDTLTGDDNANDLFGDAGNDHIAGGDGADTIYGDAAYEPTFSFQTPTGFNAGRSGFGIIDTGSGKDMIYGGDGDDTLYGGAGHDVLNGGAGIDLEFGGSGADRFVFKHPGESGVGEGNRDILDFSHAQHDLIDLHKIDADAHEAGDQPFHLGGDAFTHSAGELIQFNDGGGHTIVAADTNGDGVADFEIQLTTSATLVAGDFML